MHASAVVFAERAGAGSSAASAAALAACVLSLRGLPVEVTTAKAAHKVT